MLEKNFKELFKKVPAIRLIDMDVEETYDETSFVAFCQMLIQIGYGITFCPYEKPFNNKTFWTGSLKTLNQSNPGAVKWWNLQCYAGGSPNNPQDWADAITSAIPGFNTTGFILASDWSRFLGKPDADPRSWSWGGDCPPDMQKKMEPFAKQACVGGGFIWNIDQVLSYANDQKQKPDPAPCGNVGMRDYVAAITKGLG